MAETPEASDHTSIKSRICELKRSGGQPESLMPFVGNPREPMPSGLPFKPQDYVELVDWSGRIIREGKRGAIAANLPPVLDRLDIEPQHWLFLVTRFESQFKGLVGCAHRLKAAAKQLGYQRTPGLASCRAFLT